MSGPEPRGSLSGKPEFCPRYHQAVELIGRRWTGAVLRVLMNGTHRFGEVRAAVPGLSDRLLAERLRELEAEHIVQRRVVPGPPVRVEYELTQQGRDLGPVVLGIAAWAEKWIPLDAALDPESRAV
jgi:DNA-binding HxlR family transcriptional regulator